MRAYYLLLLLLFVPLVSANVIVTPLSNDLTVNRGVDTVFQLSLRNNNTFPIYNVSFSSTPNFLFPSLQVLDANQSQIVSYNVHTEELFNSVFVSTISYFYVVPFSPPVVTWDVNMSATAFSPSNVTIMQNDSVRWRNLLTQDVQVLDLQGSGFQTVAVPALGQNSVQYLGLADYVFYQSPLGYTGQLHVVNRTATTLAHDSVNDVQVIFNLHSVLPSSVLSISLIGNIVLNNNQSAVGYISVANNDQSIVINNIHLSADRWIANFSDNDFNLQPSTPNAVSSRLVSFNIRPLVSHTADTNRSWNVTITLTSSNAGNTTGRIPVFVNYADLDHVTINGTTYTLVVLGVNQTIEACLAHMDDAGYESCKLLKALGVNQTVIREVPAQYHFSEADIDAVKAQLVVMGDSAVRTENKQNLYLDKQDTVNAQVQNNSLEIQTIRDAFIMFQAKYADELHNMNLRFWIVFTLALVVVLLSITLWFFSGVKYFDALEHAGQV